MPKQPARTTPSDSDAERKSRLERRHAELAERVADLDARISLSPNEAMELQRLKKEKLWTKDALLDVRQ